MNSRYIHQLPFDICSLVLGSLVFSLSLTLKCKVVKDRVWSANCMHLRLSPHHHPDIFVLMCSGSGCAVQIGNKNIFSCSAFADWWNFAGVWWLFGSSLGKKKKKGGEMKELKMKGCLWRLKTWWFGHFGVGAVGIQLWLPFPLITGTTSTRTRTTRLSVCACRLNGHGLLGAAAHHNTQKQQQQLNKVFCVFALYWFVTVTSCSRYLISLCFYFQMTSWINGLIHHIGIGFVCCFFITTPRLPHHNFSRSPLHILVSPSSKTFISIDDRQRAPVPRMWRLGSAVLNLDHMWPLVTARLKANSLHLASSRLRSDSGQSVKKKKKEREL